MEVDATTLFNTPKEQMFPVCTQVTLNHGVCDSYCISCPVGQVRYGDASQSVQAEFKSAKRTSMSLELLSAIADEVAQYPHAWLRMHARGEPMLHPDFVEMIRYAKEAGVRTVQTFTDAITLTEEKAGAILEAGLDVLECSIHGHTETYEQLMRNGHYETVCKNVIRFRQLRDEMGADARLVVSAVDQPVFQHEKAAHQAFWNQYADEVIYRPYHSWGDRIEGVCSAMPDRRHPCAQLWTRCTIGPTGKVLACFNSWAEHEDEVIGDLGESGTTIASLWASLRAGQMRQDHLEGKYSLPCCKSCMDWTGSSWGTNSYERLLEKLDTV